MIKIKSYLIVLLMLLFAMQNLYSKEHSTKAEGDSLKYKQNINYQQQISLYKIYKLRHAKIVMLGNSLTFGANWGELLNRTDVVNRGVTGDVLPGFLSRLKYIYNLHPKICFIMGGINDIYNWTPVDEIYRNYITLIIKLKAHRIIPVIESTLFAGKQWGQEWLETHNPKLKPEVVNDGRNKMVNQLNWMLKNYAKEHNIVFMDLNSKMSSGNFLKTSLTTDGIHLNAEGYRIWAKEVLKVLKKFRIK